MTVLIVERDLGFAFWLGRALDEIGHGSFPAKDVPSAIALIRELNLVVDLLIIAPELSGARPLVQTVREQQEPRGKVISVVKDEKRTAVLPADGYLRKPIPSTFQAQKLECLALIEGLLGRAPIRSMCVWNCL